jgi:hypothetical protein
MSAPIQLIRMPSRRGRHQGMRLAARIGMGALCVAVSLTVCAWVYLQLPR